MKKIYTLASLMAAALVFACTPLENRSEMEVKSISASELEVSAVAVVKDGKNTNEIVVENHSPILSEWTLGTEKSTAASHTFLARTTGQQTIHFRGLLGMQKYVEKDLTVNVDVISSIPSDIAARLCIGEEGAPDHFGDSFDASLVEIVTEKNIVTVRNSNPVLSDWVCGKATLDKNIGQMKMPGAGEYPISLTISKADGTSETLDLGTVVVKDFDLPQIVLNLVGEHGEKTWVFADEKYYGVGGYEQTVNQWALDAALGSFASYFGMAGEEKGSMTLNVKGEMSIAPTGREGTFSYDFPDEHPWHVGTLTTTVPILGGIGFDINAQQPSYMPTSYFIVECDADRLVIGAPCTEGDALKSWTMCTFWVFKAVADSPMAGKSEVEKNLLGENGSKKWKFASEKFYGVGGYEQTVNQWDISSALGSFTSYFGMTGDEGGTMTLSVDRTMSIAPTGREGTFEYDFPDEHGWHIGTLSCSIPALAGIGFDVNAQQPSYTPKDYFIVSCEADKLVLGAPCTDGDTLKSWTMCTFWVFEPAE